MSVLIEFAMFPTDKGESVSLYVSKIIETLRASEYNYKLTSMSTIVETETLEQALAIIQQSYAVLEPYANRFTRLSHSTSAKEEAIECKKKWSQ